MVQSLASLEGRCTAGHAAGVPCVIEDVCTYIDLYDVVLPGAPTPLVDVLPW